MGDPAANRSAADSELSQQLKSMFAEVVAADIPPADKGRWHQRLIAITNTAKRDLARADEQMNRFVEEWNALQRGRGTSNNDGGR